MPKYLVEADLRFSERMVVEADGPDEIGSAIESGDYVSDLGPELTEVLDVQLLEVLEEE